MFKVMIRDNVSPVAQKILEATGKIHVVIDNNKDTNDPEKLSKIIEEFDGIAIRSGTTITPEVIHYAKRLKVIGRAGMGVDNININSATEKGIVVMNAPGGNSITTAEHAITMMMSLSRNIPQATASLREGRWEKKKLAGVEITGKTLGVVGLGQIGRIVADRALGLKMRVIAADPYVSKDAAQKLGVSLVTLNQLYAESDFITLHVPRLKETENMINSQTIKKMKPGVRIINCSRGEVLNLDDLYAAVVSQHVSGAALDVFPKEPPDEAHPIFKDPRIIFSPHLGASTVESQTKVAQMIANQISGYLLHGVISNAVNFPAVSIEEMELLRPYLNLSEKMGSIMGQLIRSPHDILIDYVGRVTSLSTRPITHSLLKGLLGAFTDTPINYVNARAIAENKGIGIKETVTQEENVFSSLIKLKIKGTSETPNEIWGAIFEKKYPRIVKVGEIYLDAVPEGSIIIIQNIDKPGVIGHVGTVLGKHNINIGRFQLGRREDRAVCLVNVDTPVPDAVLDEIRSNNVILSAKQVILD